MLGAISQLHVYIDIGTVARWCRYVTDFTDHSTGVPLYPLIRYPWIQLSAVYRGPKKS
jgi:hypothetical protein